MGKKNKFSKEDIDNLTTVLEKIEMRVPISPDWLASTGVFSDWNSGYTLIQAVGGNLSAAESMQKFTFPDVDVLIEIPGDVYVRDTLGVWHKGECGENGKTARAWMIAMIKAMLASYS